MKKSFILLITVVIFKTFSISAEAKEPDDYITDFENTLPEEFGDVLEGELSERVGPEALFREIISVVEGKSSRIALFFTTLLGAVILSSVAELCPEKTREGAVRGVAVVNGLLVGGWLCGLLGEALSAISEAGGFFSALIPLFSAVTLASGGVKSAAVGAYGMNTVLAIVGGGFTAAISAISGFSVAMSLAFPLGGCGTASVSRSAKSMFGWLFGIATALLMGTLSLQSLVSGASDNAAMRTARYMASSVIPMAGGTVSASLSTLASGISYVKGIIGAGAIFVILLMLLSPLVMLLGYRLALSAAASVARLAGLSSSADSLSSFLGAIDLTVAVYSVSGVLYLFEIILFIKSGVTAF